MDVLPERRFAEHHHAPPNRRIAELKSLPRGWPVLEKALHDRPIPIRHVWKPRRVRRSRLPAAPARNCVERSCSGRRSVAAMTAALVRCAALVGANLYGGWRPAVQIP
jgi:hypothetical protein